tara:strand:- start:594 stop:989 length:396 start_codon:yes stop_codon:yes gene_type:complete
MSNNEEMKKVLIQKELKNHFTPEFLNRVDEIVVFNPLKEKEVSQIVEIELLKLTTRLEDMNYNITISKTVKEFISNVGFDEKYGARPIKRAIQEKIEDLISEEVLRGTITEDKPFILDMKDEEELIVKKGN